MPIFYVMSEQWTVKKQNNILPTQTAEQLDMSMLVFYKIYVFTTFSALPSSTAPSVSHS